MVVQPVLIVFQEKGQKDGPLTYHVYPKGYSAGEYGLILADLLRHISNATGADPGEMMRIMMAEHMKPTAEIVGRQVHQSELEGKVLGVPDQKDRH